jgi:type VI protein secretion system component Hcp
MSDKFLLTMVLTKQGPVKGSSTKKEGGLDYSNGMECHGFNYPVATPVDSNPGKPVGKRQHGIGGLDDSRGMGHGFNYAVTSPMDSNPGKPGGKRHHGAIVIRKEVDAASPKLLRALSTNETFISAALRFNKIGPNGEPVLEHTIELTNGAIYGIKAATGDGGRQCEDVLLRYQNLFQR